MSLAPERAEELVLAAATGDRAAWDELVAAYVGLVWTITRDHRLGPTDASDVAQTTWLRLVENIDRITTPAHVGAWLATTARRECLRVIARSKKYVLVGEADRLDLADERLPGLDVGLLGSERDAAVREALAELPQRCSQLLRLLMLDPVPSYEDISAALGMPIGSLGPTRGRCLRRLQQVLETRGMSSADAGP